MNSAWKILTKAANVWYGEMAVIDNIDEANGKMTIISRSQLKILA